LAPDIKKIAYAVRPPENPGMEHPPGIDSPQKFYKQKSGLCGKRRLAGAVVASERLGMVPADSWPRG
jgi:hypothetical protein